MFPHCNFEHNNLDVEKGKQDEDDKQLRAIRVKNLGVSWKWPVRSVVSHEHRHTKGQSQQPPIKQSRQPSIISK